MYFTKLKIIAIVEKNEGELSYEAQEAPSLKTRVRSTSNAGLASLSHRKKRRTGSHPRQLRVIETNSQVIDRGGLVKRLRFNPDEYCQTLLEECLTTEVLSRPLIEAGVLPRRLDITDSTFFVDAQGKRSPVINVREVFRKLSQGIKLDTILGPRAGLLMQRTGKKVQTVERFLAGFFGNVKQMSAEDLDERLVHLERDHPLFRIKSEDCEVATVKEVLNDSPATCYDYNKLILDHLERKQFPSGILNRNSSFFKKLYSLNDAQFNGLVEAFLDALDTT
ncbi:hypothetical protein HOG75_03750, partial [bacterium]|nr:hypothetical protein [bacterium]